ncbi:hypothetical protein VPH35_116962 [Triticum aestivum]
MAFYSDHQAYASNTTNNMKRIQELISKISHRLDDLARQREVVFVDSPSSYDPYSGGHPYVAPTCHICGFQGHSLAECQRGYSRPPDCFGMSFAQEHSSYQNNYSHGWPENPNMSFRSNNPEILSFASSNPMQGFRYEEESHNYAPQQFYSPPTHIPQHQEMCPMELNGPPFGQPTTSAPNESVEQSHVQGFRYEEESHNYAPQQFYSPPTHIPQHQEMCPMELNGPPFGQPTTSAPNESVEQSHVQVPTQDEFDDIDKLTLLSLEFTWSAEDDPIRKVILEEMKRIKSGKELVEEVRKIEKSINAGSTISSQLELSISGISFDTCEAPTPSHPAEQDRKSPEEERP